MVDPIHVVDNASGWFSFKYTVGNKAWPIINITPNSCDSLDDIDRSNRFIHAITRTKTRMEYENDITQKLLMTRSKRD